MSNRDFGGGNKIRQQFWEILLVAFRVSEPVTWSPPPEAEPQSLWIRDDNPHILIGIRGAELLIELSFFHSLHAAALGLILT